MLAFSAKGAFAPVEGRFTNRPFRCTEIKPAENKGCGGEVGAAQHATGMLDLTIQIPLRVLTEKEQRRLLASLSFSGQAVNNALEQAHFKNVAKPMFSGRKRTGFS